MPNAREPGRTIDIVTAGDSNYAQHLSVMLVSLLECNPAERFRVFFVSATAPDAMDKVVASCAGYGCEIVPLEIDPRALRSLPVMGHITSAVYFRLLLGDVLPADVSRVLYLDSDIVIAGSIAELWNLDLGSNVIGAVLNDGRRTAGPEKLGLADGEKYFNSGMMLIDLERWRRDRVGPAALAFARDEPHRITWSDQCALNFVLRGRWMPLDRKWNLQTLSIGRLTGYDLVCTDEGLERLRNAAVIHFSSHSKPWQYMCGHPAKALYWRYLKKTPWRDYRMPDLSVRNVIRKFLMRYAPSFLLQAYRTAQRRISQARVTSA